METNKPEWFEIAENEALATKPTPTRKLPILILLSSLFVVSAVAFFSQSEETQPALATDLVPKKVSSQQSPVSLAGTPSATPTSIDTPQIGQMPTRGGDDEGEGEERREFRGDGDREGHGDDRREGHDREDDD